MTLPPPVASSLREPFLPDIDPRLGLLPPHTPFTTSHNAGTQPASEILPPPTHSLANIDPHLRMLPPHALSTTSHSVWLPAETPPPPAVQSHIRSLPNIDPRLNFLPPPTPVSHEAGVQPPKALSPIRLSPVPPPETDPSSDTANSDAEELDTDLTLAHDLDIDERSDDEDDRAAHELLRAAPAVTQVIASNTPVLSYGHRGFSVSRHLR